MDKTAETIPSPAVDGTDATVIEGARLRARRQFLKGTSLALPAVMTLHSQAVQAVTSITCGQKALDSGITVPCVSSTDDGCLRQVVTCYDKLIKVNKKMVGNGTNTYFQGLAPGSPSPVWRHMNGSLVPDSEVQYINTKDMRGKTTRAICHISAIDGSLVAVGSPTNPTNCIVTSATGACMASLALRAK